MIDINNLNLQQNLESNYNLLFIDSNVDNYQSLLAGVNNAEVIILESSRNGIEQITETLTNYSQVESIQIISHGQEGILQLGSTNLNTSNLNSYASELTTWSESLTENGDILLYGCNLATGVMGVDFVTNLSQLTDADIAASDDLTGNSQLGGDWDLEVTIGQIETDLAIDVAHRNTYNSVLATYNGNEYQLTSTTSTWEQAQVEAESLGGHLVVINDAAEQTWLTQTFGNSERLWIGLTDRSQEGNFQWVNGENTNYSNWASGEPNDYKFNGSFLAGEDYALMNWNSSGQWNDMPNSYAGTFRGIVEVNSATSPGVIALESNRYQINEESGTVEITILRTQGSNGEVTIDYSTADGTAIAGADYTAISGTLTFADGETSKTLAIEILDDLLEEGNEAFNLTISNVTGGATLATANSAQIDILDNETELEPIVDFNNFADVTQLTLNGNAAQAGDALRLTSDGGNQAGSAFFERSLLVNADTSFETQFEFQLSGGNGTGGADGFTFMLHNSSLGLNALGGSGGRLGYSNIAQSLAIEFDTYQNGSDINNNHISVLRDGQIDNALTTITAPLDLNSGDALNAWINYDGELNLLEVFLADTTLKPETALLSWNIDLVSVLGSQAFLGFSAGTGGLQNNHDITNWEFTTNSILLPEPPSPVSLNSETVISNLNQPTAIEWTPDGNIIFIAEKGGVIKVSQNGQLLTTPFIDISDRVNGTRDRGLLDIAVHPDFFNGSPYVYALYTYDPPEVFQNTGLAGPDGRGNRAGRLTRITADANTGYTTAEAGSEVVILGTNSTWENFNAFANSTNDFGEPPAGILPDGTNLQDFLAADSESHTIGSVEFGPDGALYISNGDGTSYNQVDPRTVRVQDIDNLSGKIIRIDPITGEGLADNPFYDGDPNSNRSKVYQYGLRNPFRITVDPTDGQVYVGDVGWTQWEEINAGAPGANFGWPYYEGGSGESLRTGGYQNLSEAQAFYASGQSVVSSIFALNHSADGINAIVMGDIYRGTAFPEQYQGDLFFNDLGQGIVRNISFDESGNITSVDTFATGAQIVVQIIEGPDGSLYYVDLDDGLVGRWFFS